MAPRPIKKIIVHVSDSPDTLDIGAKEIREWHTMQPPKGNGWDDIGYHWVVRRSGAVEPGRPEAKIGAHTYGHNFDSIGIVWVGKDKPSDPQAKSLKAMVQALMAKYKLTSKDVYGHKELNAGKTCPNLDMDVFRKSL